MILSDFLLNNDRLFKLILINEFLVLFKIEGEIYNCFYYFYFLLNKFS